MDKSNLRVFSTREMPSRYQGIIDEVTLAYETYGKLNEARDNAVLVIHGFSANSHVARHHEADEPGWWDWAVGPSRPLDTERYFIVCANNLGSCFGSSGPGAVDNRTGEPIAAIFPFPAIADIVFCQHELQQELGIKVWRAVIGGSLGGMAALQWALSYPDKLRTAVCLSAGARISHTGYGLMHIQSEMIKQGGFQGLRLARQLATIAYLDEAYLRQLETSNPGWRLTEWLAREAENFAEKFNPHSYLGMLHAMTAFDCCPTFLSSRPPVVIVGCAQDTLFPPAVVQETVARFTTGSIPQAMMVDSAYGHDAFLMDESLYTPILKSVFSEQD